MAAKVTIDEKRKVAIVELPLIESPTPSASGKTVPIADARNERTGVRYQDHDLKVNCQVYYKP